MPFLSARGALWLLCLGLLTTAVACTGTNTLSSYARTGDTIVVAFGPSNANDSAGAGLPVYTRGDLRAEVTDSQSVVRAVKIRGVYNVYPDPTSHIAAEVTGFGQLGLRTAIIDLVDPVNNAVKPGFALGTAKVTVRRVSDGSVVADNMYLQILGGTGAVNPFTEQLLQLADVEAAAARPQVRFRVKPLGTYTAAVGAVEVVLRYPVSALAGYAETNWPQAIQTRTDSNLQFSTRYFQDGSDEVVKVVMVNPDGITGAANPTATSLYRGMSTYGALRFAVAWGSTALQGSYAAEPLSQSVVANAATALKVFDTAGADVTANFTLVQE